MSGPPRLSGVSFRDPAGALILEPDQAVRTVKPEFVCDTLAFLNSAIAREWTSQGKFIATEILDESVAGPSLHLGHPRIFFPSYPWEWTPAQWVAAGELTLDLCEDLVDAGWILKDATPLNILFDGPNPVFVDLLSVQRRELDNPIWLAYGQFVRTFLLPLAAHRDLGWPLSATLSRRDGYEPDDLYSVLSVAKRMRAPWRSVVTLPTLLARWAPTASVSNAAARRSPAVALAVLKHTIRSLRASLRQLVRKNTESHWSSYTQSAVHYSTEDLNWKTSFVSDCISEFRPKRILDIGSNTGFFSRLAAKNGATVVAWDADTSAVEHGWREAHTVQASVTSLVADFARPTPSAGWNNAETSSLLDRARGQFDLVIMLAVMHHLLASDQIPLEQIARLTRELTTKWLLIEWVNPDDGKFRELSHGRDSLYRDLSEERFLSAFSTHFKPVRRDVLHNRRVLFVMETK